MSFLYKNPITIQSLRSIELLSDDILVLSSQISSRKSSVSSAIKDIVQSRKAMLGDLSKMKSLNIAEKLSVVEYHIGTISNGIDKISRQKDNQGGSAGAISKIIETKSEINNIVQSGGNEIIISIDQIINAYEGCRKTPRFSSMYCMVDTDKNGDELCDTCIEIKFDEIILDLAYCEKRSSMILGVKTCKNTHYCSALHRFMSDCDHEFLKLPSVNYYFCEIDIGKLFEIIEETKNEQY